MAIAIFRVDEQEWIYNEILEGRLRQGWGAPEYSLIDGDGNIVSKQHWETTYQNTWGDKPSPRRYSILCNMLQLNVEDVDIVVVPKTPDRNQFTIARVKRGYQFDADGSQLGPDARGDYRHVIDIDPDSVRTFHYRANDDSFLVSGLFSRHCHRAAVSFNHDSRQREARERLLNLQGSILEQGQDADQLFGTIISASFREAARNLSEQTGGWNGQKFEDFVRWAFRSRNIK
ncbi:MAG: hypothetical protein F4X92_07200 [Gammaproteobacteria bacterium]|nr:hypothetical protein [Gammaproteobacteria bacterium]